MRELFEVVIALSAADPNVAQALRAHFGTVEEHLDAPDGPRRRRWLERYARGALVGNAATEPGARNPGDPRLSTILEPRDDGFVLNGVKHYCTGTPFADHVLVTANTPDRQVVVVIIPTDRAGVTVTDDWDGFGQRLSDWRNVRTLASHNPARLKSRALGDLLVNGRDLPDNTYF
jgi:alkylation response protein AidB-like acyl-CoA dehydrogenase